MQEWQIGLCLALKFIRNIIEKYCNIVLIVSRIESNRIELNCLSRTCYHFQLQVGLWIISLNYTFPQFELDNKEATVSILFMYVYTTFHSFNITNSVTLYICLNIFLFLSTPLTYIFHIFIFHSNLQCSQQHAACTFDPVGIPWILQEVAFRILVFSGKVSLIFLSIYQFSCQWVLANLT